ncbi:uncharacterized protein BCR38DRAFT_417321 [Pseudomassariella vexata]|uniref:Uncharacterized protein n=1 Tax=Pseudomassariella vexata TaxID=1141098 RepID=A0A1Y2EIZ2_9PEZI|nr:uncharacterized protein BCR38DRAFT_417321 [Pseudomassariella vexata]ORY71541.1 hypothetical protein BCR38DRAFT_417321 [Pseudomassariella vexata]
MSLRFGSGLDMQQSPSMVVLNAPIGMRNLGTDVTPEHTKVTTAACQPVMMAPTLGYNTR